MLEAYRAHVAERAALGIPPLPLSKQQTTELVALLKNPPKGEEAALVELITYRVPAGVDDAAKVKAEFLAKVAKGEESCALISKEKATELLGTMLGGFNVKPLIDLLADGAVGAVAAEGLKKTLLVFDYFHDVAELAKKGNANAKAVMQSWADAEWFTSRPEVPASQKLTVFKVTGETNTDDLSPAPDAWSRPDIPLHALAMLKNPRPGIEADEPGSRGPIKQLEKLAAKGNLIAYVGDVVGTGSSRKSATNSVLWFTGEDIPFVPNKRFGGVCLGSKIAPIFFNTMEDAGALPIEIDAGQMDMGDEIELKVDGASGKVVATKNGATIAESQLKTLVILDEVRAGGRIPLIIGRGLTTKAREALGHRFAGFGHECGVAEVRQGTQGVVHPIGATAGDQHCVGFLQELGAEGSLRCARDLGDQQLLHGTLQCGSQLHIHAAAAHARVQHDLAEVARVKAQPLGGQVVGGSPSHQLDAIGRDGGADYGPAIANRGEIRGVLPDLDHREACGVRVMALLGGAFGRQGVCADDAQGLRQDLDDGLGRAIAEKVGRALAQIDHEVESLRRDAAGHPERDHGLLRVVVQACGTQAGDRRGEQGKVLDLQHPLIAPAQRFRLHLLGQRGRSNPQLTSVHRHGVGLGQGGNVVGDDRIGHVHDGRGERQGDAPFALQGAHFGSTAAHVEADELGSGHWMNSG